MVPILSLVACVTAPEEPPGSNAPADVVEPDPTAGGEPEVIDEEDPKEDEEDEEDCVPAAAVVINELSPANAEVLRDIQGESVDWLELYNADTVPVALGGWTLSDDGDDPAMWAFPDLVLEPGAFLVVYASGKPERTVVTWDTRVDQGDVWRYLDVVAAPDPDWFLPGYDDSGWLSGPSGFGYGDGDDATEVTAATVYVRTGIELSFDEAADLVAADLWVDYDDGFVAYLDGVEVARDGVGVVGTPPGWDEYSTFRHNAQIPLGLPPIGFSLAGVLDLLTEGPHTLAVEVHDALDSSDLSLVPILTLGYGSDRLARPSAVLDLRTELHTNFELRASGERVRLYDASGCESDDLEPGPLYADQSYGRQPDGTGALGYFLEPTPGASNTTESRPAFSATPTFSPSPGYYPGGTDVTVVGGAAAELHVAWGGFEPTEQDPLFAGAVHTGNDGDAVVIRARSWEPGLWPSRIGTATYLLHEPGTLPILSLVTDPPNLWDEEDGIYVLGSEYEPDPPYYGANFWEDWDRPLHVQSWEPGGLAGFAVDAGVSIHGNRSRNHDQKSLLIELGSRWGESSIEYDLFPGLGVTSFERLLLRAGGQDWLGCTAHGCGGAHLRDGLMHGLTGDADIDVLAYRPAEVYLNGEYWGIYHMNERPDAEYVATHHGWTDIDLLEQSGEKPVEGDALQYVAMLDYLRTHDLTDPAVYAEVETLIEVEELTTYLIFEIFYANTDWPGNNIKYWRPRTSDGRWRWMMYDTDFGLGSWHRSPTHDTLGHALDPAGTSGNPPWSTELFRLLVQSPEFSEAFVNRYADLLNTLLVPDTTRAMLHAYEAEIAAEIPRHVERWGTWTDGVTMRSLEPGAWEAEVAWIDQWLGQRPDAAREHLVDHFGLAGTWTLQLEADPPAGGTFAVGTVEVEGPFTGIYFQDVPITVTAIPAPGYVFAGWSDPNLPPNPTVTLDLREALDLEARFD